jgi:hypothetical protein
LVARLASALRVPSIPLPVCGSPSRPASTHELGGGIWRNPPVRNRYGSAMRSYPRCPRCQRWLPTLSIMAFAMGLCGAAMAQLLTKPGPAPLIRSSRESAIVLVNGIGVLFALYVGLALFVTRRWHGVSVRPLAALRALLSVGLAFPLLFWGVSFSAGLLVRALAPAHPRIETDLFSVVFYASMIAASAAGAWWVAAALARLTGTIDRRLRIVMVAYGALWPLVQPLAHALRDSLAFDWLFHEQLAVGPLFAWQLPIGLASAAWFLRATLGP